MTWIVGVSGLCLIAPGLLITPTVFHPDIFDISIGEASLMPYWAAGQAAGLVAMVLTMFGMAGLGARHGARLGALGLAALVVTVPALDTEQTSGFLVFTLAFLSNGGGWEWSLKLGRDCVTLLTSSGF